jgi:YidC/Oxa1 family membrane protein insertase
MPILTLVLAPIIEAMRVLLVALHHLTGSYGTAIILLSLVVRLVTAPISRTAAKSGARDREVRLAMETELGEIRATSRGRERFDRTEALYNKHNYHPIKSMVSLLPLFLQVPFLLAALFLLSDYPPLAGESFLIIPDLLKPDGLLSLGNLSVNVLPLLITLVTFAESAIKVGSAHTERMRFLIIGLVIALLIYSAPASVCIYWLTSTLLSLLSSSTEAFRTRKDHAAGRGVHS